VRLTSGAMMQAYAAGNAIYILGITSLFLLRKPHHLILSTLLPSLNQPVIIAPYRKHHHLGYLFPP
jgi:hypothetical protein